MKKVVLSFTLAIGAFALQAQETETLQGTFQHKEASKSIDCLCGGGGDYYELALEDGKDTRILEISKSIDIAVLDDLVRKKVAIKGHSKKQTLTDPGDGSWPVTNSGEVQCTVFVVETIEEAGKSASEDHK